VPITLMTTILPVVLMAMSITDEIHLLERLQGHLAVTPADSLHGPVEAALTEVGRPIIATSVTTALGFLSFLSASIGPMREFGVFTALGILTAMVLTFAWIPALIVVLPSGWFRPRPSASKLAAARGLGAWSVRRPALALAAGAALVALSVPGVLRLRVQDAWVDNFAAGDPLVSAERTFNDAFWGSYRFDVVVEGDAELFYTPLGAGLIEELEAIAAEAPHVGGVLSYLAFFEEIANTVGEQGPLSSLSLQQVFDVAAIAEMSESRLRLRQLLTDAGEAARVRLFVADADYARSAELVRYLDLHLPELAERYGVGYHYSGDLPAALAVVSAIVGNQLRSIGWTLLTVTIALLLLFARGRAALIAMVPVTAAVAFLLGGMGYLAMPLGIATSMFAALTVGVGVDFGIHIIERYRQELDAGRDHDRALQATFAIAGRAVGWNALVLGVGFTVLVASSLKPNHSLGVLLASAMLACYAGTMMFLPRLLRMIGPAALALVVLTSSAAMAAEKEKACDREPEAAARAVVAALETAFRADPHITRMDMVKKYGEKRREAPAAQVCRQVPGGEDAVGGLQRGCQRDLAALHVLRSGPAGRDQLADAGLRRHLEHRWVMAVPALLRLVFEARGQCVSGDGARHSADL
jgi:predicted RND superfamily exporter protein